MNSDPLEDQDLDEIGFVPSVRHLKTRPAYGNKRKKAVITPQNWQGKKAAQDRLLSGLAAEREEQFEYTYRAGPLESDWLYQSLGRFREQRWIDDILRVVKGGKEATVYLCRAHETTGHEWLAAKVYRPRKFRNLKNDWLYREGRGDLDEAGNAITNKGLLHAIHKRTEMGRQLLHASWLEHEYKTMVKLHAAGADVPQPFAAEDNAILMQYFGDEVMGAPTLNEVDLDRSEARPLFERVVYNLELMLAQERVHGDLSAFNILYWEGEIALIDFPQAIHPEINRSAYPIFLRDVTRICDYFRRQGVKSDPVRLAEGLWAKYHHSQTPAFDPRLTDEDEG